MGLLHHSDQACTYASEDYQKILADRGLVCSMSRRGNPYDDAVMEAWNSTFKIECGERFLNNEVARNEAFDFIEVFYNQMRLHSAIGYVSPAEFEATFAERDTTITCTSDLAREVLIHESQRSWDSCSPRRCGNRERLVCE